MSDYILLSSADADAVRNDDLQPRPLIDGRSILPVEVLSDPAHESAWPVLAGLPTAPLDEIAPLLPPDEVFE